jgi:RHS repeat-associated protein
MEWNEKDQLHNASNGTFTSYYNYDAQGNRTRKVVEKAGGITETRYYIGGYEVFRKEISGTLDTERVSLHILDLVSVDDEEQQDELEQNNDPIVKLKNVYTIFDKNRRIVLIETLTVSSGSSTNVVTIRYQYSNHLGSACLELDNTGDIISYEEYHPFGTTSYRSGRTEIEVSLKRYKYIGKERDNETGLYYYGARYYAAWLCRFISVDPLFEKYPNISSYAYCANNPVKLVDTDGMEFDPKEDTKYVQPMEQDIKTRLDETRASMERYEEGSDEYNRLSNHATELDNALTEINALRNDQNNLYKINFGGMEFKKEAGGKYLDAFGSVTYGGVNEAGQNIININLAEKYTGTTGTMLHEFKHADQYRMGKLGFYVNEEGKQTSTSNNQQLEKDANYRGEVYSFKNTIALKDYKLNGYNNIPEQEEIIQQYQGYAKKNDWIYITNKQ